MTLCLLPYLTRFVTLFAGHSCFRFIESLTIGFAIGGTESKYADVAIRFFELFL